MFKTAYGKKDNKEKLEFKKTSMTQQHCKDECDINNILRKWKSTGSITHEMISQPQYLDCPDSMEYTEALNIVVEAETAFSQLPSKLREAFHNNPVEMLAFVEDPSNHDEAVRLGLLPSPASSPSPSPEPQPKTESEALEK